MGIIDDSLVGSAIGVAEDKLQGSEQPLEKNKNGCLRFFISFIWGIITFVASLIAFLAMIVGSMKSFFHEPGGKVLSLLAIGLCFLIFLITFIVPYLRKKGTFTRWCGVCALGDAIWWIYILVSGLNSNL